MTTGGYSDSTLFRRLLRQTRPYWPHCGGLILLNLLLSPLALLTPLPLKIVVDSAIDSRPLPGFLEAVLPGDPPHSGGAVLLLAVCLVVGVALLMGIVELATSVLRAYVGQNLTLRLRTQLFRHAQRLSFLYHDTRGVTDSGYRIQYDAQSISVIVADGIPNLTGAIVMLVGMIYVTFRIDWQLALVALAISPFLFLGAWAYRVPLRSSWREVRRLESSALSVAQEVLGAMRVVTAFGQEAREGERFARRSDESVRRYIRVTFVEGTYTLLIGLSIGVGTAAVLFIGVRHVQSGTLTLGDLLLVMGYLTLLYGPVKTLSKNVGKMQQALASMERTYSLLDEVPDVAERPNARPLSRASGAVAFCAVSFAYRKDRPVVRNVSFEVEPGIRLGISGTTGAGKSTLMNLLTRFYDPTEGVVKLDGVDLRDYKLADLRNQFAIVLQDTVLFSTSIAENIAYSRPGASEEEVVEAAKASNAHEFIAGLPSGYETQVGERGMSLSGGQRQRIALARAFLRNAPILILDEPTSSVDVKIEAAIMEAMERLMRGRTTFMIAHRLGTLANCDLRLEVEDGRVVLFEQQSLTVAGQGNKEAESLHRSKEIP